MKNIQLKAMTLQPNTTKVVNTVMNVDNSVTFSEVEPVDQSKRPLSGLSAPEVLTTGQDFETDCRE